MKKILSILCLLILTSCGYEPLYKENQAPLGKVAVSDEIFIAVIPDREGQILRNILRNKVSMAGEGAKYTLKVDLHINTSDLGINIDDVATRRILWVSASFQLLEGDKVLFNGSASNNVSYAVNDNEFTTMTTKQDEIEKSLRVIAEDIKLKVSSAI